MKEFLWAQAQKFIKDNKGPIYLWFGTQWCGDCHMMLPIIEEVEKQFLNKVTFIKVDAEESKLFRVESKFQVKTVPTHVFINNSEIKSIMYEYIPEQVIIDELNKCIYDKN